MRRFQVRWLLAGLAVALVGGVAAAPIAQAGVMGTDDVSTSVRSVRVADVVVPNLVGLRRDYARNAIIAAGLTLGRVSTIESCGAANEVVHQRPAAGSLRPRGSAVRITVGTCSGPRP